jgi:tetratricopeptide (TPR) repeat protein
MESDSYQLERRATELKKIGDWDGAIAALRRVKALAGDSYEDTRLAKYLQDAGRFDEAMAEIQWLLDRCAQQCKALFGHQPEITIRCQEASHRARIHAAAALICKRAKAASRQSHHETEAAKFAEERLRLHPLSRQAQKDQLNAWEAAKRGGAAGISRYLKERK